MAAEKQLMKAMDLNKKEIDIDYDRLFKHAEKLKKVLLVASGRSSSDFFQSLLDGHSEILQFRGTWFFHFWWKEEAKCRGNLADLINEFIWHSCSLCNHIAKFKSYYEKSERWDQLGDNKDDFFEVDIDVFKTHMYNLLSDREVNSRNFFLAVNLAYGLATNVDIGKTKIIFYHIHHMEKIKEFKDDFPAFDVICTIREPRNTLVSGIEHWKRYRPHTYTSRFFYQLLKRIFQESEPISQYIKDFKTLKLEDIHQFPEKVLGEFCRTYNLELQDCLFESSYHGKKWWGDRMSGKYLDGFSKKSREKKWQDKLFFYDNLLIELILEDRLRHYGYFISKKIPKIHLVSALFLMFLPMKYELKILAYNFRDARNIKDKLISISKAAEFYALRILLYGKYILRKLRGRIFLAKPFIEQAGSNKAN